MKKKMKKVGVHPGNEVMTHGEENPVDGPLVAPYVPPTFIKSDRGTGPLKSRQPLDAQASRTRCQIQPKAQRSESRGEPEEKMRQDSADLRPARSPASSPRDP